jgi:hypothetical protein
VGAGVVLVAADWEPAEELLLDPELLVSDELVASDPVPPLSLCSQPAIKAAAANKMNSFFIMNMTPYR